LKAIAEKLIPGIPVQTRISILQQTSTSDERSGEANGGSSGTLSTDDAGKLSVLETVIDRATSRNEIQHEIDGLLDLPSTLMAHD